MPVLIGRRLVQMYVFFLIFFILFLLSFIFSVLVALFSFEGACTFRRIVGDDDARGTPVPIPNTEVKPSSAENT